LLLQKQSVGVVKKWYGCEKETVNVDLYYGASKVDNATSVSSLDHFHDGIVVFHAVDLDVDTPAVDVWTTPSQAKKPQVTLEVAKSREHGCVEPMLLGPLAPSLSVQTTLSSLPAARASPLTSTITSHKVNTYAPTFGISSNGVVQREQQTEIQQGTLEWNQWINKMLKTPPGPSEASPMKAIPEIWRLLPNDPIPDHHVETYSGQLSREDLALSLNEIVSEPLIATETPLSDIQSKFSGGLEAECLKDPQADKSPVFVALDGNDFVESPSLFVATPQATPPPAPKSSTSYLRVQKLLAEGSPEDLEAEVRRSLSLLEQLKISVSSHTETGPETQQWSQQIETLKLQNVNEPTIIGVVGNTGARKSSVINAILDEERLVPTNCMRACTAVVTEMSWNNSDDENEKYRAEIEFIQSTDWEMELRIHFAELQDGNGKISREAGSDADSGASVAYAKIKAVYPHKTKDDILKSSVEHLMQEPAIRDVLGTTRKIHEAKLESFYNSLQHYVDSREKPSDDEKREMALWPLIKVVKIYTKSNALSTGAVIVDLPGIMDSNTARGSVAKSYMKKCTGLWIVAPINRAVDDRAARNLMGDAFKRQLKYDGTYSQVTFICSKTDDISITEASESLGLDDEISPKWNQIDLITKDQRRLEKEIEELRISQAVYYGTLGDANEQLEFWEDDKMASASTGISKKRKMASLKNRQRKRRAPIGDSDDDDSSSDTSGDEATPQLSSSESSQSMAVQAMNDKISELKDTKDARMQRRDFTTRLNAVKDELKTLKEKYDEIMAEISIICISARNLYSKT
jgi:hypothetical protein